tara:strand:- start:53 stop:1465 length:1413 start_codon:yes stop_codon:yes gene_type:complete
MKRFKSYLTEEGKAPTKKDFSTWLKSYVKTSVENSGITIVGSARPKGVIHIRFPMAGNGKTFFSNLKLSVSDFKENFIISSKYTAYVLKATENITIEGKTPKIIPKGTEVYWVNSEISQTSGGGQLFANKALSPDKLDLAGREYGLDELIKSTTAALKRHFPDGKTAKQLSSLLPLANTTSDKISFAELDFTDKDFPKISADYGEILAAIWTMKNRKFAKVNFPKASNHALIDFYGVKANINYPFSVKSGATGGKVTVKNIIASIKGRAKTANADNSHELADEVISIVQNFSMKEQMIMLHQKFKTPVIISLSKIMKCSPNDIDLERVASWTKEINTVKKDVYETKGKKKKLIEKAGNQSKDNHLLVAKLEKWHKKYSPPKDKTLKGRDLTRFIVGPLGQSIYPILNKMPGMQESLTRIAQQVTLIQVNVNVKTKTMTFSSAFFKKAEFQFDWAGYSGGNTLGFTMKMKK